MSPLHPFVRAGCCRGNRLKQLPASVGSLTALKWLAVSSNLLKALPPALGLLTSCVSAQSML